MSDRAALLRAILTEPADDTVRLVFADWLDENGEPERAEFIRVQVEIAKETEPTEHADFCSRARSFGDGDPASRCDRCAWGARTHWGNALRILREREWELSTALSPDRHNSNGMFWLGPDFPFRDGPGGRDDPIYRRGFISEVTCAAADWLAHADALFWHPAQTVGCGKCFEFGGRHAVHNPNRRRGGSAIVICPDCAGTGRAPRPCPETAQPIVRVVFTTTPETPEVEYQRIGPHQHQYRVRGRHDWFDEASCEAVGNGSIVVGLFTMTFPGIEFALQPA